MNTRSATDTDLPRHPAAFIWHYTKGGFRGQLFALALLICFGTGLDAFQAFALGHLVAAVAAKTDAVMWFLVLTGTWLFGYLFSRGYGVFSSYTVMMMRVRIHDEVFAYLLHHAPRYFLDNPSGTLAHKIRLAAGSCTTLIDYAVSNGPRFAVLLSVTAYMMVANVPGVVPYFVLFLVVFTAISAWLAQYLRTYAKASSEAATAQSSRIVDTVANWDSILSFARNAYERGALMPFSEDEAATQVKLRVIATVMRVVLHVMGVAFLAWFLWLALQDATTGTVNLAVFTTLVSLSVLVSAHVNTLGDSLFVFFETYGNLASALDTILAPHEVTDAPDAKPLVVTGGAIALNNVSFTYPDGTPVFHGLNLAIAAGEKVGLVGPSGAGKSTLVKLIRRHFPIQSGAVTIDRQDIAGVTWESLHHAMAEVPQNPGLFHRSVRENILYGRPTATEAEMVNAAKLAHCHEFIAVRAGAYDAIVGERGMKLSGGEKQRVAVARAFLKDAPILILDEATSSLDSEAEHLIQDALLNLMKGRTVIAIAHRLSTIMGMDRIVVLQDGRIVEEGAHETLLARNGVYAQMWKRQVGGFM
ncbi:MAG: ABC transporter ATP-binding protein [Rhodospirillaceae bacterium]|nr:ABC transporter ATP-binding protein [Rhodospirillaceae bacterium]